MNLGCIDRLDDAREPDVGRGGFGGGRRRDGRTVVVLGVFGAS